MNINVMKLHQELAAAGIPFTGVNDSGTIWFLPEATAEDQQLAAQILAAHDPVDYVAQEAEGARVAMKAALNETINQLMLALDNWETLTIAQQQAVLKRNTQTLVHLLRYMRATFEA